MAERGTIAAGEQGGGSVLETGRWGATDGIDAAVDRA